jgi:leucyl-tRNA synthetase
MWPKGFFCNGWLMVNNEKMSKSKGNFFTMNDIIEKYTADSVRLACANAGDTLEDANLEESVADDAIMAMHTLMANLDDFLSGESKLHQGAEDVRFVDRWFANEMNRLTVETKNYYEAMYFREALRTGYYMFKGRYEKYLDICRAGLGLPNKTLIMRYFEWQTILLCPITPHFCEHIWGKLGKKGTVLDARWPEPTAKTDAGILVQGDYVFNKVSHDLIKLRDKVGKPESAVIYVAKNFPDWKVAVLKLMRDRLAAGQLKLVGQDAIKNDAVASEQWKDIIKVLMSDPELKKFGKHVGPFAAFKRDEAAEFGADALNASVPFDEMKLLTEHIPFLKAKLMLEVSVCEATQPQDGHADAAGNAQPGKPGVYYSGGAPAAKAKPAKSGGGGDAKGGAPKAAPKASTKGGSTAGTITDLKALNSHLSTRSYFEGGYKPTAADAAQLAAMPKQAITVEEFPHVLRWCNHIKSFTDAQRSKWE